MGLQSQLNDVSSDSIPLLMLSLIATTLSALRSFILRPLPSSPHHDDDDDAAALAGSGLSGLVLLSEQLSLNKALSYTHSPEGEEDEEEGEDCVVCRCRIRGGDHVRELPCRHVFHHDCLRGWLLHNHHSPSHFTCPLCRFHLVPAHRADLTRLHLGRDLLRWFSSF